MASFRIVLADMPPLVADILRDAARTRSGVEVLGPVSGPEEAGALMEQETADAVIVGSAGEALSRYQRILWHWPRTRLICIQDGGRRSALYRVEVRGRDLGPISAGELLSELIGEFESNRSGGDE